MIQNKDEIEQLIPSPPPILGQINKTNGNPKPNQTDPQIQQIRIFGFQIPLFITKNVSILFIFLAIFQIISSLIFAFLQEKVTAIDGFIYPKFITVVQTITFTFCAFFEMMCSFGAQGNILQPKAPKMNYFKLSFLTFGGMLFTNWGLKYLSYPTRIIFKGAKPVPTMTLEYFYVGKIFKLNEIISVGILTIGIILFCSGEAADAPTFNWKGVVLMMLGVTLDSLTSNYEKKNIFNHGSTHTEAMFWASLYGSVWSIITLFVMDPSMLMEAMVFVVYTPEALIWLIISSVGGYTSVVFVLLLIKIYSTTYAECVKGVRKVLSIALSYLLLAGDKSFGMLHGFGVLCFIGSILMTIYNKSQRKK